MRTIAAAFLVLLALSVRANEQTVDEGINDLKVIYRQLATTLEAIKDKRTAEANRKDLEDLGIRRDKIVASIAALKLSPIEREAAQDKVEKELASITETLQKEAARTSLIPGVLQVIESSPVVKEMGNLLEDRTRRQALNVEKALKIYMLKNDGNPPKKLDEVGRYLENPKTALLDPWGQDYRLGSAENDGFTTYYVWTVSPFGGGKKKIASWEKRK
jgi:hypothetical protein